MRTKILLAAAAIASVAYGAMATDAAVTTPETLSAFSRREPPPMAYHAPEGRLVAVGDIVLEPQAATLHGMAAPVGAASAASSLSSGLPVEASLVTTAPGHRP